MSVFIHPSAEVSDKATIGDGTKIWNQAQIRENVTIGKDCIVAKDVYLDVSAQVGNSCKLENSVSVYKGVQIEDNVFVGAATIFTNDKRPRAFIDDFKLEPTLVKMGASIGANSTIVCGITIGRFAMAGAGSVVTKDVPDHGLVYGNPAQLQGFVCDCGEKMVKKSIEDSNVLMFCPNCLEEVAIPLDEYKKIIS